MSILGLIVFLTAATVCMYAYMIRQQYYSANPAHRTDVYRVAFDEFIELYAACPDFIILYPDHAEFFRPVDAGGHDTDCRFVFSFIEWRKYCNWYDTRRMKEVEDERIGFEEARRSEFEKILSENREKHTPDCP